MSKNFLDCSSLSSECVLLAHLYEFVLLLDVSRHVLDLEDEMVH